MPDTPFEYAEWKRAKVHPNYHIEILHGFHSVPHRLIGRQVDVRLTHRMIEIFHNHERVAVHRRRGQRGGHTTIKEHMPKAHRPAKDWPSAAFCPTGSEPLKRAQT